MLAISAASQQTGAATYSGTSRSVADGRSSLCVLPEIGSQDSLANRDLSLALPSLGRPARKSRPRLAARIAELGPVIGMGGDLF